MTDEISVSTASTEETRALGRRLGTILARGDLVALIGNLGAGKTTLTQGIGAGLGIDGHLRSPTFTLVNEYRLEDGVTVLHLDGYRLGETMAEAMLEADTFGMDELLDDERTIVIIEWADLVEAMLPADRLEIRIVAPDEEATNRDFTISATGPRSREILEQLRLGTQIA
jgi:tRNA threonylcarbamoyladenosine biosynthesis protein TsaE